MATKFSKGKLAEVQEKNAKTGLKEGLLSKRRRKDDETSKGEDPMVTSPVTQPTFQHLASPITSLEIITPTGEVTRGRGQDQVVVGTFWDDVDCVVTKAHDAIFVEDLKPLMTKLSTKLVSSHVHKAMQVCSLLL